MLGMVTREPFGSVGRQTEGEPVGCELQPGVVQLPVEEAPGGGVGDVHLTPQLLANLMPGRCGGDDLRVRVGGEKPEDRPRGDRGLADAVS